MADSLVETPASSSSHLMNLGGGMNQMPADLQAGSSSGASSSAASVVATASTSSSSTLLISVAAAPAHGLNLSEQIMAGAHQELNLSLGGSSNSNINTGSNSAASQLESSKDSAKSGRSIDHPDDDEPEAKRKKIDKSTTSKIFEKLEARLGGILCCAVCLDLPRTAMYQCSMGHLMCAGCFTHLLADGRLRDQNATCPNCRTEISKNNSSRNLAVEKAVSELPSECQYCGNEFPNKSIEYHESNECEERPTDCKFSRIGCQWRGPIHEVPNHETNCAHPKKSGAEVMVALQAHDARAAEEKKLFLTLIDLLSYEKIIFNDLQLKPYRTDEYVHRLYYETSRFSAFNHQWVVKAIINKSQRDPHQSCERDITYQLILKSKTTSPLSMHFFVLRGPFSDIKVSTQIYKHDFTETETESPLALMPLPDTSECNRLLAAKAINFRLIMFLASK
ncbi:zinc finger TRAF-type-containing protein 1 homolog [Uranotaenia lowii]|uniref:zinc finger TRAF-type-containing protein 1 homolog n=1 Tax=Uranotaenia lowii TaxID=190385 RepID=UPI0024785584|nr:zinc finger TRAF-type-containing protein 1 homolog [Uranotaenia lowii]